MRPAAREDSLSAGGRSGARKMAGVMKHPTALKVGAGAGRRDVRILFSCAGRRVELISAFIRAAEALGIKPVIHTADVDPLFAASCISDKAHQIPATKSRGYLPALLEIARRERIDLLIPLLDPELGKLASAREQFARRGCNALVSSPAVVRRSQDKLAMYRFLVQHGIDTPRTWTPADLLEASSHQLPYFLKPRKGSASQGNFVIRTRAELDMLAAHYPKAIIQEFVKGVEHTLDVYTGFDGQPRCVVPRERIEVRGGEVTKARTVKNSAIIEAGLQVVRALRDCVGVITIQVIATPGGQIRVIEVNPRFGGGVPLAIHAGADFPRWLLQEWRGEKAEAALADWRDGVTMLRYHESFFQETGRTCRVTASRNGRPAARAR